jgi:hypothetical protein
MANRMSTNVKLLILLGVLGIAAAVKAFVLKPTGETGESAKASEALFPELKKEDITAFVIEAPEGKKHELVKENERWTVVSEGNARADQADVNKVLDAVTRLKRGKVSSTKGENLARYGLDASKAIKITVWGKGGRTGTPAASFSLGKIADDWRNAFLQLPGASEVRKIEGGVADYEPGTDETWRDKTMYDDGPAEKVAHVEIVGPKGAVVVERRKLMGPKDPAKDGAAPEPTDPAKAAEPAKSEEGQAPDATAKKPDEEVKETYWVLASNPAGADGQAPRAKKWLCDSIAGYAAKLECDSFFSGTESLADLGLDPPQFTMKVQRDEEKEARTVLLVGNKSKDGKYAVKLPDLPDKPQPQVWWIASWKGDYLTKTPDELLETPPAKPEEPNGEKHDEPGDAPAGEAKPVDGEAKKDEAAPAAPAKPEEPPAPAKPDDGGR